jgi:S1-C subfamily serine protease
LLLGLLCGEAPEAKAFPKDVQENARLATVRILNITQGGYGSGVIVMDHKGVYYILTARHVVGPRDSLRVLTYSKESGEKPERTYLERECKLEGMAEGADDLAVIKVLAGRPAPGIVPICPKKKATQEKTIPALLAGVDPTGAPKIIQMAASKKPVRLPQQRGAVLTLWSVDREQEKGWSGGPLVDQQGYLVGICSGRNEGKGYYCTLEQIHKMLYDVVLDWIVEE